MLHVNMKSYIAFVNIFDAATSSFQIQVLSYYKAIDSDEVKAIAFNEYGSNIMISEVNYILDRYELKRELMN